MTQNLNEDKIKKALRERPAIPDPAALDRAVKAAMSVYEQERNKKKQNSLRGFTARLRQTVQNLSTMGAQMRMNLKYAVPALTAVFIVVFLGIYGNYSSLGPAKAPPIKPKEQATAPLKSAPPQTEAIASVQTDAATPTLPDTADRKSKTPYQAEAGRATAQILSAPSGLSAVANSATQVFKEMPSAIPTPIGQSMERADVYMPIPHPQNTERFANAEEQNVKQTAQEPVSTFSMDVDTASYTFVRKLLSRGRLPSPQAVRVEEMINYFSYDYKKPDSKEVPFATSVAVYPCPWNKDSKLLHVGVKAYRPPATERPKAHLTFLIDVSGSMSGEDRLPMLKTALADFTNALREGDSVGIVTYSGKSGVVLEPTLVSEKSKILQALAALQAGGSTAGSAGLATAYELAERSFDKEAVNRVILATDGDFNVGASSPNELQRFIEQKREKGIYLTILGVGSRNLNDALMQRLAQYGNGTAAYLDNLTEARRVLGDQTEGALVPVADDAKVQIEFNPSRVAEYRLIGYETRNLRRQDFNNDKVDAGDIGAGQTVTAIYEITPTDSQARQVDPLRYEQPKKAEPAPAATNANEYAFLKIRYKLPGAATSKLLTQPIGNSEEYKTIADAPADMRFAASVAGFGQLLRHSMSLRDFGYDDVLKLAETAQDKDPDGLRREFLTLVRSAKAATDLNGAMPQK
ncbi:MAG: VWA domain-containing protein [Alphaproteobacteria bacterium]|nr:VWA domain-containing protein [Alphaproteobacteria bacterium]